MKRLLVLAALAMCAANAAAQQYPAKNIRIVVGAAAGGGVDTITRVAGQNLSERWGQPVVVENRPGAGGAVAGEIVAKAAADGHTLYTVSISHSVLPSSHKNLAYSPERDLVPVAVLVNAPNVLVVHPSLPAKSVKELIAVARAKPGEILYSSSGNASPAHLAMELFKLMAKIDMVHVPYKGTSPGITDLISGRVSLTFASIISTRQHVSAGKLRMLATAGSRRAAADPAIPTMAEAGVPGYAVDVWYALLAPAATPRDILAKLNTEIAGILHSAAVKERISGIGLEPVGEPLDKTAAYIKSEIAKWARVVKAANITAN